MHDTGVVDYVDLHFDVYIRQFDLIIGTLEKLRWEKPARHSEMNDQPVNFTGHRQQEGITAVQENMCTLFKLRHIVINKVIDKQTEFSY